MPAIRRAIAAIARLFAPGYSWCHRCGMPWKFTEGHTTWYTPGIGCFPLCEKCWRQLTPSERVPHYVALYDEWSEPKGDWDLIRTAVMEGK